MSVFPRGIIAKGVGDVIGFGANLGLNGELISITGPTIFVSAVLPENVVTANVGSLCIVNDPSGASVWLKGTGTGSAGWVQFSTGGGSSSANVDVIQAYFDFTSSTDILIGTVAVGDTLEGIKVEIFDSFNGTSPTISVGDPVDHSAYFAATAIPAGTTVALWEGSSLVGAATTIRLYSSFGGSTAGTGRVSISIRRA